MHITKRLSIFILIFACLLTYSNSFYGAFVSDDINVIVNGKRMSVDFFYPLDVLRVKFSKTNPFYHHCVSVGLHIANVILLFFLLTLFFPRLASLLGALIFAVHPVNTEAVNWISANIYLYTTMVTLASLLLYFHHRRRTSIVLMSLASIRIFIRFITVWPFFFFVECLYGEGKYRHWRKIVWLALWVMFLAIWWPAFFKRMHSVPGADETADLPGLLQPGFYLIDYIRAYSFPRIAEICTVVVKNITHLFFPFKLAFYHIMMYVSHDQGMVPSTILNTHYDFIMFTVFIFGGMIYYYVRTRDKPMMLGIGFLMASLAIHFTPRPVAGLIGERYLYIATIAMAFLAASVAKNPQRMRIWAICVVIALFAGRTYWRNFDWQTDRKLWEANVRDYPTSVSARQNLAANYLIAGKLEEAENQFARIIKLDSSFPNAWYNLGLIYQIRGKYGNALWLYKKTLSIDKNYYNAYHNMSQIYQAVGDKGKAEHYHNLFKKANKESPDIWKKIKWKSIQTRDKTVERVF